MRTHAEIQADADLFTTLHQAIAESLQSHDDRRGSQRRPYSARHLMAPFDGATMPAQDDYALVSCRDLSPSGFSFMAAAPPLATQLIIALGRTPFRFFVAEIANQRTIVEQGERRALVGCRFVRRVAD